MYKEKLIQMFKSPAIVDIFRWSRSEHLPMSWICIFNFLISGSTLVITLSTKGLIDGAVSHNAGQVKLYAWIMVATVLAIRLCATASSILQTKTGASLQKNLRTMVLHSLLHKQYTCVQVYHSGELVNRMFSDAAVVKNGIMGIVPQLVSMAVSFLGAAIILISMDWRFAVLLTAGGILGLALTVVFKKPMSSRHKAVQESEGRLHVLLQETLEKLRLIKANGSEARMERKADSRQQDFLKAQLTCGYFSGWVNTAVTGVFHLSWLFCMLWGARGIYKGLLTYGSLAAIIQLVGLIQSPIAAAAELVSQAYGTISSAERLKELLDLPEEEEMPKVSGRELYADLVKIQLSDLSFDYGREPVLQSVNAEIYPGDFVAVTGPSGSGKSTFFQLLLGIYPPVEGNAAFCFSDHMEMASIRTRPLFAYVPQGNTLFSGTLRDNIAIFTENADDWQIMEAARIACIDELVETLPNGLNTVLGERGMGLSEGQAQRVAIARAILTGAPVLLLDESTSALDAQTEAKLLRNLARLPGKTCLIVTHRKAALEICDYSLHVEQGTLTIHRLARRNRLER